MAYTSHSVHPDEMRYPVPASVGPVPAWIKALGQYRRNKTERNAFHKNNIMPEWQREFVRNRYRRAVTAEGLGNNPLNAIHGNLFVKSRRVSRRNRKNRKSRRRN